MEWNDLFPADRMPEQAEISRYIGNPLWDELCRHIEDTYRAAPRMEHSVCSGAPGWNVKYRKGGRSLCTLYPHSGFAVCLVVIGRREASETELLLSGLSREIQELYASANPVNGCRWLMIPLTSPQILSDIKKLIQIRAASSGAKKQIS